LTLLATFFESSYADVCRGDVLLRQHCAGHDVSATVKTLPAKSSWRRGADQYEWYEPRTGGPIWPTQYFQQPLGIITRIACHSSHSRDIVRVRGPYQSTLAYSAVDPSALRRRTELKLTADPSLRTRHGDLLRPGLHLCQRDPLQGHLLIAPQSPCRPERRGL